jgi:hypothetical protein
MALKLMTIQFQNIEDPVNIHRMISLCENFLRPTKDYIFQDENKDYVVRLYEKLIKMLE